VSESPDLQLERNGRVVLARVQGDVDISWVEALRAGLVGSLENRDLGLVVDLTAASYLDSAGINMLFDLAESLGRRQIQLAAVVPDEGIVARVASLVSLDSALPVHRSAEAALAALEKGPDAGD
jgi:anti-anti-sigma factor